jgi:hypothetical protein
LSNNLHQLFAFTKGQILLLIRAVQFRP